MACRPKMKVCFKCSMWINEDNMELCEECYEWVCDYCGGCFCNVSKDVSRAVKAMVLTYENHIEKIGWTE